MSLIPLFCAAIWWCPCGAATLGAQRVRSSGRSANKPPNILYILLDDYGWADAGWHAPTKDYPLKTPHMNTLVREGVELDRHYAFPVCSPSRSAIQSGREPLQVNAINLRPFNYNPKDNVSGFSGIPRKMTGIAEVLKGHGYNTHLYGKWDAGWATPEHTPKGRGYDDSLSYGTHENAYWGFKRSECGGVVDLLHNGGAPYEMLKSLGSGGQDHCDQHHQGGCIYEELLFERLVNKAIQAAHMEKKPFFIFWGSHLVHDPYEVPKGYLDRYSSIHDNTRKFYFAMAAYLDDEIGRVVGLLHKTGEYANTLIIVHSDNGGDIGAKKEDDDSSNKMHDHGANNYPLRGSKNSQWDGGIRVAAFVSGGVVPTHMRGKKLDALSAVWDWYATIAAVAGVHDIEDKRAKKAGLPPVSSINLWPVISGRVSESPRSEIMLGDDVSGNAKAVGVIIKHQGHLYKLLMGRMRSAVVSPANGLSPGARRTVHEHQHDCGESYESGCLFDLYKDPQESNSIARSNAGVFHWLKMKVLNYTAFNPDRGADREDLYCASPYVKAGHSGPFLFLN